MKGSGKGERWVEMGGEMGRNQMLQNIFGEHFDEDEEEEEVDSEHDAAAQRANYPSVTGLPQIIE